MKTKHVIVIAMIAALVILLATALNVGITNNKQSCTISSTWNSSKTIGTVEKNTFVPSFEPTSIVVVYKNQRVGDLNAENSLIIDISDKDFGPLRMPLYKKGHYNINVSVTHVKKISTSTMMGILDIKGNLKIDGDYRLIGTTSTKEARNMVVDKVLNTIYTEVKKKITDIENKTLQEYPGLSEYAIPAYLKKDSNTIEDPHNEIPLVLTH